MSRRAKVALAAVLVALVALAIVLLRPGARSAPGRVVAALQSATPASPAPGTLIDALLPNRPMMIDSSRSEAADWVSARPGFQYSHSAAERGGIEPCATQEVDTA